MKKRTLVALLLALAIWAGRAQTTVWNDVVTGFANTPYLTVPKVALYGDRTELTMHVEFVKGQWIRIAPNTVLQAGGKEYAVKEANLQVIGEQYFLPEDTLTFTLTFDPMPADIPSFDFVEPDGWILTNIHSASTLPKGITDTYWRDVATGDWLIGFAKDHVIYQNKIWDIVNQTEKKDAYVFYLWNGPSGKSSYSYSKEELDKMNCKVVKVGKMKKGLRTIAIDNGKPSTCSPITTAALPDYPTKDLRKGFVDNGFNSADSVTIIGWLKDMPEQGWKSGYEFAVSFENILTNQQESAYAEMDSLGRFALTMPLFNSTEVFLDWGRSSVNAFLEPGKTYFFLNDFKTGQKLWMGDDVRVQNELLAHRRSKADAPVPYDQKDADLMEYWAKCDSVRLVQEAHLKALQQSHPMLSQRYVDYIAEYYRMLQGRNMMQAQFTNKDFTVPAEYLDYVCREFWQQAPHPYTIYRDFFIMNTDFLSLKTREGDTDLTYIFKKLEEKQKVVLTDAERQALNNYKAAIKQVEADLNNAASEEEKQRIAEEFNSSEMVYTLNTLIERNTELMNTFGFQQLLDIVDSLGCDRQLRDIILAQRILQQINNVRQPVSDAVISFAENEIQMPEALALVKERNDHYLDLMRRDISDSPSLKSADDLANMSQGEQILRKIIEPYKGKIILLDIWGTWCNPCKEALSHSAEEFERLEPFDMVFLYLANRSSDESWKNVIKEYNVMGDNVVHYNLPPEQQSAVEHFLKVNSFPTYKLIDENGNILDENANPRNLDTFVQMLETMKGKRE